MAIRLRLALLALAGILLAAPTATSSGTQRHPHSHVLIVVLENHEYDEVFGNPEARFLTRLAHREAWATRYYAVSHPSLPNYLALLGGSTFGISSNCTTCSAHGSNLALQLSRAGIGWRAYMGGMPRPCFRGTEAGRYVKRHDPFVYFPSISSSPKLCRRVVPAARLDVDLRRDTLPSFAWLSPDLCDDAHDCGLASADRYLADLVPRAMRQLGPHGALIVTFDEGSSGRGCCGASGGGHVLTTIARPGHQLVHRVAGTYNHYSLLAALERHFGVPRLRRAREAKALPLGAGG
jgi:phospholipase C